MTEPAAAVAEYVIVADVRVPAGWAELEAASVCPVGMSCEKSLTTMSARVYSDTNGCIRSDDAGFVASTWG
jgi:hypothetical protein